MYCDEHGTLDYCPECIAETKEQSMKLWTVTTLNGDEYFASSYLHGVFSTKEQAYEIAEKIGGESFVQEIFINKEEKIETNCISFKSA